MRRGSGEGKGGREEGVGRRGTSIHLFLGVWWGLSSALSCFLFFLMCVRVIFSRVFLQDEHRGLDAFPLFCLYPGALGLFLYLFSLFLRRGNEGMRG